MLSSCCCPPFFVSFLVSFPDLVCIGKTVLYFQQQKWWTVMLQEINFNKKLINSSTLNIMLAIDLEAYNKSVKHNERLVQLSFFASFEVNNLEIKVIVNDYRRCYNYILTHQNMNLIVLFYYCPSLLKKASTVTTSFFCNGQMQRLPF